LISNKVYNFEEKYAAIMEQLDKGVEIELVKSLYGENDVDEVITFLHKNNLGDYYENNVTIERIKTARTFLLENDRLSTFHCVD
jgi:hypothetical protein